MLRNTLIAALLAFGSASVHAGVNDLYNQSCATCHAAGVLGAPKSGDKAAWAPRLKQGMPTLVSHTKNGFKNMPARGLCDSCTDADYMALIKLMSE
jgi:cytochrome c5